MMDQFKPSTILVQDSPLVLQSENEYLNKEDGLIYPDSHDYLSKLMGEDLQTFIDSKVLEASDLYKVDQKRGLVFKY